jgi:hypothetical protein
LLPSCYPDVFHLQRSCSCTTLYGGLRLEILGEIIPSGTAPGVSIDYSLSANEDCEGDLRFDTNQSNNQFRYTFAEVGSGTLQFDDVFYLFVEARPDEMFSIDISSLSFELGASCNGGTCTESNVSIFGESSWTKAEGDACTVNDIDFTFGSENPVGSDITEVPLDIEHNVSPGNLVLDDYDLEIVVVDDLGTLEDVVFKDDLTNPVFEIEEKTQTGNTYRFYLLPVMSTRPFWMEVIRWEISCCIIPRLPTWKARPVFTTIGCGYWIKQVRKSVADRICCTPNHHQRS